MGGARASCGGCLCERSLNDNAVHQGLSTAPSAAHAHLPTRTPRERGRESLGKLHSHAAPVAITQVCQSAE